MHSPRVLGAIALGSVAVAAVSFAIVDIAIGTGCDRSPCSSGIPVAAITFAALGALALLVSVLPAVTWIVDTVRSARSSSTEDDREVARAARPKAASALDDEE